MSDIIFVFPVILIIILSIAVPLINMFSKTFGGSDTSKKQPQDARYSRQVHQMHVKDSAGERQHRLDQLKSLYRAGMMEKDEYLERVASVEADYR